jgi:hypothetical protein
MAVALSTIPMNNPRPKLKPGETTSSGQRLVCFQHEPSYVLADKINNYADKHNLEIEWCEFMQGSNPRIAYIMYRRRAIGHCAECGNECPETDYLCRVCRT